MTRLISARAQMLILKLLRLSPLRLLHKTTIWNSSNCGASRLSHHSKKRRGSIRKRTRSKSLSELTRSIMGKASTTRSSGDDVGQGQGELYSPESAIKIQPNKEEADQEQGHKNMNVAADHLRRNLSAVKDKVLEKLSAAKVPVEAVENARNFLETVTVAAQGLTKEALHRIKSHLVDILPSISPALTRKMVDDAATEAKGEDEDEGQQPPSGKAPASSLFALVKPSSRL